MKRPIFLNGTFIVLRTRGSNQAAHRVYRKLRMRIELILEIQSNNILRLLKNYYQWAVCPL